MRALFLSALIAASCVPARACDRAAALVPMGPAAATAVQPAPDLHPPRQRCISPADLEAVRALYAPRWVPLPPRRAVWL